MKKPPPPVWQPQNKHVRQPGQSRSLGKSGGTCRALAATKAAWQMGPPQWPAAVAHQPGLGGVWAVFPLVLPGPRNQPLPLQAGARVGRSTFRLCSVCPRLSSWPATEEHGTGVIKPLGHLRPVRWTGRLPALQTLPVPGTPRIAKR